MSEAFPADKRGFPAARRTHRGLAALIFCLMIAGGCADSIHDLVGREDLAGIRGLIAKDPSAVNARTSKGKTPLHYAVTYRQADFIDFLAGRGADLNAPDNTGLTPLHAAAMLGRVEEAERLIRHGAHIESRDSFGDTPLETAALFGQAGMVKCLLQAGADARVVNNDDVSPKEAALRARRAEVVEVFEAMESEDD